MGLDKQPTPPPKRVRGDGGGQDIRVISNVPPDAQKAMNGQDDAETSSLGNEETQIREERASVGGKARDGERQPPPDCCRDMLQRSDSPRLPSQAMTKTLKQMMKALLMMLTRKRRRPGPLKVRLKGEMSLRPKMMGTMASKKIIIIIISSHQHNLDLHYNLVN